MAPPKYKVYYFPSRGRCEYIRYIFALADVEYEDVRVTQEEWPQVKSKMPFGQMPALEMDGKIYAQSYPICRYLAKEFGLHGDSPLEQLRVDMIVECQEDFNKPLISFAREQNEDKKKAIKKKFVEEQQPKFMEMFETILKENNGGDGFFVGETMSLADLAFYHGLSWPSVFGMETPWSDFPKLMALKEKVENHPRIAAWIEKRPVTPW